MVDLISRQAAIDAVKSYWKNEVDRIPKKSTDFDVFTQICDSILTHNANICKAIDKLPSAQPVNYGSTKSDSSSQLKLNNDLISRQAAIDALDKHIDTFDAIDKNYLSGLRTAMSILKEMPSAQPETHDKRTETHACDLINRQQAIDAVVSAMIDGADAELVEGVMELLPSAQPETPCYLGSPCEYQNKDIKLPYAEPQHKTGKWITVNGRLGNEVECNQCHSVFWYWMGNYRFCPHCGAKMGSESDE